MKRSLDKVTRGRSARAAIRVLSARRSTALLLLLVGLTTGCKRYQPALPTTVMRLGAHDYTVEIASDDPSRDKGLMYRDWMPDDYGMVFVFPQEQPVGFYMKNTRIPLDIVFLDHAGRVVSIKTMQPFDLRTTPSDYPALYAIELNAGQGDRTGLRAGDAVQIPPTLQGIAK